MTYLQTWVWKPSPTGGGLDGELSAEVQRNIEETMRNRAATTTPPPAGEQAQQQGVIIDRPTAARLAAEDPYFARFEQVLDLCMHGTVSGTVSMTATQCRDSLKQGADRWCGIEFFDALKCEYATALVASYNRLVGTFGNQEIPSFGELFPGEPNPFSTTTPP